MIKSLLTKRGLFYFSANEGILLAGYSNGTQEIEFEK